MIVTVPEGTSFILNPVLYSLSSLSSGIDYRLNNSSKYSGDKIYLCTSLIDDSNAATPATIDLVSGVTDITLVNSSAVGTAIIGDILHIRSGLNVGVYYIADSTSATHIRVQRTNAGTSELDIISNETSVSDFVIASWTEYADNSSIRDALIKKSAYTRKTFTGRDYETIRNETLSYMKKNYGNEFNNYLASDLGIMLIEVISYMLEGFYWRQDFISNELILSDAKLPSSVAALARYLGYKPSTAVGSSDDIVLTLNQDYTALLTPITIYKGMQIKTTNGIIFEVSANTIMSSNVSGSSVSISVVHGVSSQDNFISTGEPSQEFPLSGVNPPEKILHGSVHVIVNGTEWTEVDLLEFNPSLQQYEIDYMSDPPVLRFGDGVVGVAPIQGASISVTKRYGYGSKSNVASGSLTSFSTPLIWDGQPIDYTIVQSLPATGGANEETISEVKSQAPKNFLSTDRAVTQNDWDTLASSFSDSQYGSVAKAKAVVERNLSPTSKLSIWLDDILSNMQTMETSLKNALVPSPSIIKEADDIRIEVSSIRSELDNILADRGKTNHVVVYALTYDAMGFYSSPTSGLLLSLATYLNSRKLINTTLECIDGISMVKECGANISVKIDKGYKFLDIKIKIEDAMDSILKGRGFYLSLYVSSIYQLLMGIDGINYVNVKLASNLYSSYINNDGDFILTEKNTIISKEKNGIIITEL